jgi:hypothetical protein
MGDVQRLNRGVWMAVALIASGMLPVHAQQGASGSSLSAHSTAIMDVSTARAVLRRQVADKTPAMQAQSEALKQRLAPFALGVPMPPRPAPSGTLPSGEIR